MPKKIADTSAAPPVTTDDKLDLIVMYLHRMDKRDHLRTIGGTIKGLLSLIPVLLVIWSAIYFYQHGAEVIKQITDESVKSAASMTQSGMFDQFNTIIKKPKQP
jgi:hypothetical protein